MTQQRHDVYKDFRSLGVALASTAGSKSVGTIAANQQGTAGQATALPPASDPPMGSALPAAQDHPMDADGKDELENLRLQLEAVSARVAELQHHELKWMADQDELTRLRFLERDLQHEKVQLELDRAAFEADLDELATVKARELAVEAVKLAAEQREQACDRKERELNELQAELAPRRDLSRQVEQLEVEVQTAVRRERFHKGQATKLGNELAQVSAKYDDLSVALERHKKKVQELRQELRVSQAEATALTAELDELKVSHATASVQLERQTHRIQRLERALKAMPDLQVMSEELLQWLGCEGTSDAISFDEHCILGWSGTGPYLPDAFDRLLLEVGLEQHHLPNESITHVIVGREGWSREDLLSQIECRAGATLRIYSQEMLLAALMTGRDPLDADDEVLQAFKEGHPALEFLADPDIGWPAVMSTDTSTVDELGAESEQVDATPLKLMGYRVGESSPLSKAERRAVLREAFHASELPWVESDAYMSKWGQPDSHQRLWRIARHIAWLASTQGRDYRKETAQQHWVEDLQWLRETLYLQRRYRFVWPTVDVA